MALFLSTIINKRDKKGRVSVPAAFRIALSEESFSGIVLFRSLNLKALEGSGFARLKQVSESIDQYDLFSPTHNDLADCLFADAHLLAFDSEGRIMIPETLLGYAGIRDQVAFVGRGATFQLWQPEAFQAHQDAARQRLRENPIALNLGKAQHP